MTRIFTSDGLPSSGTVTLVGNDSVHVASSLRMKSGETLILCDGRGKDAVCVIRSASPKETVCEILDVVPSPPELPAKVYLYQSLPKGDKFEFILQKTTELGITCIVPVLSDRCISRPDAKAFEKKLVRYRGICREAAQQCGRGAIPEVAGLTDMRSALSRLGDGSLNVFCYEKERDRSLRSVISGADKGRINVFIGPEGGYSDSEAELAVRSGLIPVTFGKRILRCETAPVYVMSAISYELS